MHHPGGGTVFYVGVGLMVFFANIFGLWTGFREGQITFDVEGEDNAEARREWIWFVWSLFTGVTAQSVLWPLFLPQLYNQTRSALEHGPPTLTTRWRRTPFQDLDHNRVNAFLCDLGEWGDARPEPIGDPVVVVSLMDAAVQHGLVLFKDDSSGTRKRMLRGQFSKILEWRESQGHLAHKEER